MRAVRSWSAVARWWTCSRRSSCRPIRSSRWTPSQKQSGSAAQSARRDLEQSIRAYEELGLRGSQAYALNRYAMAITIGGEPDRAIAVYQDAMRLAREVHQSDDEAMALHGLGENYLRTGRTRDGIACLRQALEIYRRLGMPEAAQVTARLAGLQPD